MIINITKWKFLTICLIIFVLSGTAGFSLGLSVGVKECVSFGVEKAFQIIGDANASIALKEAIKGDLWRYRNNIGGCSNAFIYSSEGA